MSDHITNRDILRTLLEAELVGPASGGKEIDCTRPITFASKEDSYGSWCQMSSREEILQRDPPFQRYGVGVLTPLPSRETRAHQHTIEFIDEDLDGIEVVPGAIIDVPDTEEAQPSPLSNETVERLNRAADRVFGSGADEETDDIALTMANAYKPSSMAISFFVELHAGAILTVNATGGRYREIQVKVGDAERDWWLRSPVTIGTEFSSESLHGETNRRVMPTNRWSSNDTGLDLQIEVFSRQFSDSDTHRLVTVCFVNRSRNAGKNDEAMLFQSRFTAYFRTPSGQSLILPYPEAPADLLDDEEQSLALLYRGVQTFAIGHGCAADWEITDGSDRANEVRAECLPVVEVPSITPEIRRHDRTRIAVSMRTLAGLEPHDSGIDAAQEVIERYEAWIAERLQQIIHLEERYRSAAQRHLGECRRAAERMRAGLQFLQHDARALHAFQLANHAMLLQQTRFRRTARDARYDREAQRISFAEEHPPIYPVNDRGYWRPFQIAFLLASLESSVSPTVAERETVELIWFPTGGGKTEAYLGLAAFAVFYRRLTNSSDVGVHVLMRYTLRLLTAQQFQRASGLICAMEFLRRQHAKILGAAPISIGIWLGGDTTPNTREQARSNLKELQRGDRFARNRFIITRCPWCAAQLGPREVDQKAPRREPRVIGYSQRGDTVALSCSDRSCEFKDGLPIHVVDEDIYSETPTLIIGTVDKFAMLAWRPQARAIFGIDANGDRYCSPPGLIIQDELHLISGPLGSMVGLYEAVIEDLCTDYRFEDPIRPKIVSSTATIRRYAEQIKALYARDEALLFPPPGLDAGDSFFARYATREDNSLEPGRMFIGVHAPGLGSLQTTQARVFATLLQAPMQLPEHERDPWWTLLIFFNSLRELGSALSLFQSRVPDYLWAIRSRMGIEDIKSLRRAEYIKELTSRLRSDEVPAAITELEAAYGDSGKRVVDACLASSIVEVGIDIDRLSLMTIVGQPKTTSQYIQVTGRVGRSWWERPGLVVTLLSPSRPRDRSHFEKFRTYHERLYAQVEPTSVTPFSPPALDRALHAVMTAYVRQRGDQTAAESPQYVPETLTEEIEAILHRRVAIVDSHESANLQRVLNRRKTQWHRWNHRLWDRRAGDADLAQLYAAGEYIDLKDAAISWATPMSMRTVDAECQAQITRAYLSDEESDDDET
jgi:hypothetical protein